MDDDNNDGDNDNDISNLTRVDARAYARYAIIVLLSSALGPRAKFPDNAYKYYRVYHVQNVRLMRLFVCECVCVYTYQV